jgi:hypothetical protein
MQYANSPEVSQLSNEDFVRWCIIHILGQPEKLNSYFCLKMIRDLNYGVCPIYQSDRYSSENSMLNSQRQFLTIDRTYIANVCLSIANKNNYYENKRMEKLARK